MKMAVFWVVVPCSLVGIYQRFRGPYCLNHQEFINVSEVLSASIIRAMSKPHVSNQFEI
jgi:hypothetical protein